MIVGTHVLCAAIIQLRNGNKIAQAGMTPTSNSILCTYTHMMYTCVIVVLVIFESELVICAILRNFIMSFFICYFNKVIDQRFPR